MKKKVLYGVFMACFAFTAVGTLQSCKDELSDFEHQTNYNFAQMEGVISGLRTDLENCKTNCSAKMEELRGLINANTSNIELTNQRIDALNNELRNYATIKDVDKKLSDLEKSLKDYSDAGDRALSQKIGEIDGELSELESNITSKLETLDGKIDALGNTLGGKIDQVAYDLGVLQGRVDANTTSITNIKTELETLKQTVEGINLDAILTRLSTLETNFTNLQTTVNNIGTQVAALQAQYNSLSGTVSSLAGQISTLTTQLNTLTSKFNDLTNRVQDMLTSILVQGVDSPIFGNFSLPIGIKSNIAFDWYGTFDNAVKFPSASRTTAYDAIGIEGLDADFARVGAPSETYPAGYVMNGNLGNLYVTINPIGHNLTEGKTFSLETSAGKKYPVNLNVEESDQELVFGYSRSAANGFYSAEVTADAENAEAIINAVGVTIDENLKTSAKNLFNDFSKHNAYDLLKAVYNQLDGMLPAYALRADWTTTPQTEGSAPATYSVLSGYDLAVATAKPLSYKFFYGEGSDRRIPTHGHIDNIINDLKEDLSIKLNTSFDINTEFKVQFDGFDLDMNTEVDVVKQGISITIPSIEVRGDNPATPGVQETDYLIGSTKETTVDVTVEQLDGLYSAIETGFENAIANLSASLNTQINQQIKDNLIANIEKQVSDMLKDIKKQVNDMLANLEVQINDQISNIIDELSGKAQPFFDKVNQMIDVYNKVAEKINSFLANPNHYLQVAVFYKGNGTVGILSNVKSDPTQFANGGGDAISLYLSSYSGEIVCPAYKKFVAVTNCWNASGVADNSQLRQINANGVNLNKILDGRTIKAALPASSLKSGYVYEILYQGLDYFGATSTQKFYITVK